MQTATGTKDKISQHWIEILLQKSRELKSNRPGQSIESIATELQAWLRCQPGDKYNPLLSIEGITIIPPITKFLIIFFRS